VDHNRAEEDAADQAGARDDEDPDTGDNSDYQDAESEQACDWRRFCRSRRDGIKELIAQDGERYQPGENRRADEHDDDIAARMRRQHDTPGVAAEYADHDYSRLTEFADTESP
jgi:hypothetical protein